MNAFQNINPLQTGLVHVLSVCIKVRLMQSCVGSQRKNSLSVDFYNVYLYDYVCKFTCTRPDAPHALR